MTKLRDELSKIGNAPSARLYVLATEQLRKHEMTNRRAAAGLVDALMDGGGLLAVLLPKEVIFQHALIFVERVARDMRIPPKGGAGVRVHDDSQNSVGPGAVSPQGERGALKRRDSQETVGSPQHSPQGDAAARCRCDSQEQGGGGDNSSQEDGAVQRGNDSQSVIGRSDSSPQGAGNESVHSRRDSRTLFGTSLPEDRAGSGGSMAEKPIEALAPPAKPARGLAALKAVRAATPTIFDSHKLRDGTPIGELRYSQLDRYMATNAREAYLLLLIKNHARPHDENLRVREIVKQDVLEQMITTAKEWPNEPGNIESLRSVAGASGAAEILHQGRD